MHTKRCLTIVLTLAVSGAAEPLSAQWLSIRLPGTP